MKKIYFWFSIIIAFLIPNAVASISASTNTSRVINNEQINITTGKYLNLSFQGGKFYTWNQADTNDQHIIGIFNKDDQSYLLDSFGVFWDLDFQILNFYRVSDTTGIAYLKYFKNVNNVEYFDKNFIVSLTNNAITVNTEPINSKNIIFTRLDDTHAVAYGIGLELIDITNNSVTELIEPYDKGEFSTTFYLIDANDGIFVAGDQFYYLLTNIQSGLNQTNIPLTAPNTNNNVVVLNSNDAVIRAEGNSLHFVQIDINSSSVIVNDWIDEAGKPITSKANNFAFALNANTFILNPSLFNSSSKYGTPFLVQIDNWNNLIPIANILTIDNFIINDNNGIFIDKDLQASTFTYQSSDNSFTISPLGTLNSFQFINPNLFFGSIAENNVLLNPNQSNAFWTIIDNIEFSPRISTTSTNLLNNMISANNETIDYRNTYFSDGTVNLNITDFSLREVIIAPTNGPIKRLTPIRNNVNYNFLNFDTYEVTFNFSNSGSNQSLIYYVNIVSFKDINLIDVSGTKMISYVGVAQDKLYDIKVVDQTVSFMINNFNYDYLQYAELYIYQDATNAVVKNKYSLTDNTQIAATTEEFFFGIKAVNLLNQVTWTYLGFSQEGVNPMVDFWDTEFGASLMNQAIGHRYLERDLRKTNSDQILQLIKTSETWDAIAIQGKSIVISVATIFALALVFIVVSIGYNIFLNKKIEIEQVEKNKILKNPLDL